MTDSPISIPSTQTPKSPASPASPAVSASPTVSASPVATATPAATATPTARASSTKSATAGPRLERAGAAARWTLAVAACLWLAWCTAVGPLYRADSSLARFGWFNAVCGVGAFTAYLAVVVALACYPRNPLPRRVRAWFARRAAAFGGRSAAASDADADGGPSDSPAPSSRLSRLREALLRLRVRAGRMVVHGTDRRWKIWLVLFVGWLWVPTTLLAAFGADIRSQAREFSWAWNQWTGMRQPYIGFFSFVPMDIYPTAHYLWPDDPTYLSDQHNIVLTLLYGATMAASRYLTGSNDAGIVLLAAAQFLFAVSCVAATAHRVLNLPWLHRFGQVDLAHPERSVRFTTRRFGRPETRVRAVLPPQAAHATMRVCVFVFFLCCPLAVFSTISLTKSPLFAFAFTWAFGFWYELYATSGDRRAAAHGCRLTMEGDGALTRLPWRSVATFGAANVVMLVSAKYAWYVLAFEFVSALLADRRRWRVYAAAVLLPTVLVHGGIAAATSQGLIIGGDPIESRGVQLQMIARVAQRDPESIPDEARELLAPVFNLDQMADAYNPQDADPVKSSGIQSKKVSYRWRTVEADDMDGFNRAWLLIVEANPTVALDALFAKCYGYFDVADVPYVAMGYYVDSDYVQKNSTWIKYYNRDWRGFVAWFADAWGSIPVLGWVTHGNCYVVATLLVGAAEVVRRRWRALAWHLPLLLLMGVMITAPANNFERHMLPVAFCFAFLALVFHRDSIRE